MRPISITLANQLKQILSAHGIDASYITATSSEYVDWTGKIGGQLNDAVSAKIGYGRDIYTMPYPGWGYCLDAGYVSNYPAYVNNFKAYKSDFTVPPFGQLHDGTMTLLSSTSTSTSTISTTTSAISTSTNLYTVSVNYDKFTAESKSGGYTSVYTNTGTNSVNMAIITLAAGSSLTATQAISQLASMGYRPATLSEIYSLKQAQPSVVNSTLVALGTNLGGSYGYPTGFGAGTATGLGHYAGPFSTSVYKFAAVKS